MRAILTAAGVLALAAAASAATLKVPQQYDTIGEALGAAEDGDTIVVSRGVYYESVGVEVPNVKLIGKKAVIDGSFNGIGLTVEATSYYTCLSIYSSGVTVQGFTFRNGQDHVDVYGQDCKVLKCVSRNAGSTGVYVGSYDGFEISGNKIIGAGSFGIYVSGSSGAGIVAKNQVRQAGNYGIYVSGGVGVVVDRNVVGHVWSDSGIYHSGPEAVITGNRVSNTGGRSIQVYSAGARVEKNRASWSPDSTGIYVSGTGAVVQGNSAAFAYDLFEVYGNDSRVVDNRATGGAGGAGFYIGGDAITVTGNIAQHLSNQGSGFYIYSYSGTGGGLLEDNSAADAAYSGFYFSGFNNGTVRGCSAIRCGFRGDRAGFFVYGSATTFESCEAVDCHGDGFYVDAGGMTFTDCSAKDALINGFQVYGSGNIFNDCGSTGSGGQGFHNRGQGTVLSGGVFLGNRIDIANNSNNLASFSGGLEDVDFVSGGEAREPDVFWYD